MRISPAIKHFYNTNVLIRKIEDFKDWVCWIKWTFTISFIEMDLENTARNHENNAKQLQTRLNKCKIMRIPEKFYETIVSKYCLKCQHFLKTRIKTIIYWHKFFSIILFIQKWSLTFPLKNDAWCRYMAQVKKQLSLSSPCNFFGVSFDDCMSHNILIIIRKIDIQHKFCIIVFVVNF